MLSWVTSQNSKWAMKCVCRDLNFLIYFYYCELTVLWLTANLILFLVRLLFFCEGQLCQQIDFCKALHLQLLLKIIHRYLWHLLTYKSSVIVNQGLWYLWGHFQWDAHIPILSLTPCNTFIDGLRENRENTVFTQVKFTGHTTDERVNDDRERLNCRVICFSLAA